MRKPVTFRFDTVVLERARLRAVADNRSLTNFVETAVRRALERSGEDPGSAGNNPVSGDAGKDDK